MDKESKKLRSSVGFLLGAMLAAHFIKKNKKIK